MATEIHGAGIVLYRNGTYGPEFLLLKSAWGKHWSIPKGHRNKKESVIKAAFRETYEETGIDQNSIQLVNGIDEDVTYILARPTKNCPNGIKTTRFLMGHVKRTEKVKLSREHTEYVWARYPEAMRSLRSELHILISKADGIARTRPEQGM